jgi:enamine deaminase RidA (YjgF/YER057c/UK114 family)
MKYHNPASIAPPMNKYSQGVEVPPNARWLYISGQIGVQPDGTIPTDPLAQARQAWLNMIAIVEEAGMGMEDVVRVNGYVTTPDATAAFREVRNEMVGENPPASTLVQVAALASPGWVVEVECVAAKA